MKKVLPEKYFSVNRITGLCSMLLFTLFVTFGSSLGVARGILFFMLGTVISFASFYVVNLAIPLSMDAAWLAIAPFMAVMALCSLILKWDIYLPFLFCGLFSVALSASSDYVRRERSRKTGADGPAKKSLRFADFFPVLRIFGTVLASALLFVCICGFVEVFI